MPSIKGYKYTTESSAKSAQKQCNDYYGIPVSPDDVTQNWIEYNFANLNEPSFWYIVYNESLNVVLGEPIEFDVVQPPLPPLK
jgi:hypothetical protein